MRAAGLAVSWFSRALPLGDHRQAILPGFSKPTLSMAPPRVQSGLSTRYTASSVRDART